LSIKNLFDFCIKMVSTNETQSESSCSLFCSRMIPDHRRGQKGLVLSIGDTLEL
jgi:hypothetical protein